MSGNSNRFRKVNIDNTNIQKHNRKEYTKIIVLVVFLALLTIGVSYAFFSVTKTGNKNLKIVTGNFRISFNEGQSVNINEAYPMTDEEGIAQLESYTFSIKNEGNIDANYNISLKDVVTDIPYNLIKYSIRENDGEWGSATTLASSLNLRVNRLLVAGETINYEIKFWIDESAGNDIQGKSFSAKIEVTSVQKTDQTIGSTSPIIKVNSDSTIEVEQGSSFTTPTVGEILDDKDKIDPSNVQIRYEYYDGTNTTAVDSVDTSRLGIYYIHYSVTDSDGNLGTTVITVIVKKSSTDHIPKLTLVGDQVVVVPKDGIYSELGVIATDDEDGDLTNQVQIIGEVDTKTVGVYTIKYVVTDSDGNTSSVVRTVVVSSNIIDPENPNDDDVDIKVGDTTISGDEDIDIPVKVETKDDIMIIGYYFGKEDKAPAEEKFTMLEPPVNKFEYRFTVEKAGVYYLYILDSNHKIHKKKIVVRKTDTDNKDVDIKVDDTITSTGEADIPVKVETKDDVLIIGYYFGKEDNAPAEEKFTKIDPPVKVFDYHFAANEPGDYYLYILDSNHKIYKKKIVVNINDTTKPICSFSESSYMTVGTSTIDLICTDNTAVVPTYLTNDDFHISDSDIATIVDISGYSKVERGYKYTISLKALKQGDFTISLNQKTIYDPFDNYNDSVRKKIFVKKLEVSGGDTNIEVNIGETKKINLKNSVGNLIYESSNPDVVTVDQEGNIHGLAIGNALITVVDPVTSSTIELSINVYKKLTVEYVQGGPNVTSISDLKTENISCKLTVGSEVSCDVTLPDFSVEDGYKIVGWSKDSNAHYGVKPGEIYTLTDDIRLYAIYKKPGVSYSVKWDGNGSSINSTESRCSIPTVYNGEVQPTSCDVQTPDIIANRNTPIVVGYNSDKKAKTALFGAGANISINKDDNGVVYYAITKSAEKNYTVDFIPNGYAVSEYEKSSDSCTIPSSYNGEAQKTSCSVQTPKITIKEELQDHYEFLGWNRDSNAKTVDYNSEHIEVSENLVLYTITKSQEKRISATFHKQGLGVEAIGSNQLSCTVEEKYNPTEAINYQCLVDAPSITVKDGYEAIGWNRDSNAREKDSNYQDGKLLIEENGIYFSISKKVLGELTAIWNANGSRLTDEEGRDIIDSGLDTYTCELGTVYNNEVATTACSIKAPIITRGDGYVIDGFGEEANSDAVFASGETIQLTNDPEKDKNAFPTGKTWYAQVHKDVVITWNANGAKIKLDDESSNNTITTKCEIKNDLSECRIKAPTIERDTYEIIGFNRNQNATTSDWNVGETRIVSESDTYYAITSKNVQVMIYYNVGDRVESITDYKTIYNKNGYSYQVPKVVSNSIGLRDLPYKGIATEPYSTQVLDNFSPLQKSMIYYAVYEGDIENYFHYYNQATDYSESVETTTTRISSVIANKDDTNYIIQDVAIDVPENVINSTGIEGANSIYYGVSKNHNQKIKDDTITTQFSDYYAIYKGKWEVQYTKDQNTIESIGATKNSCDNYVVSNEHRYVAQPEENCSIELPHLTEKEGHENGKWYDGDTLVGGAGDSYQINASKILIAKAAAKKFTITYDCATNGGVCDDPIEIVEYGSLVNLAKVAEKEGYEFIGWSKEKDAKVGITDTLVVDSDLTLYAIYKKNLVAQYYYNKENKVVNKTTECVVYNNEDSCLKVPDEVANSSGPYGTSYIGLANSISSMSVVDHIETENTYYAVYQSQVTQYYDYFGTGSSKIIYRNSYIKNVKEINTVLSELENGLFNLVIQDSTKKASGLMGKNQADVGSSVSQMAKTTENELYTTYKEDIDVIFTYYDNDLGVVKDSDPVVGTNYYNYDLSKVTYAQINVPVIVEESRGIEGSNSVYYGVSKNENTKIPLTDNLTTEYNHYYAIYKGKWEIIYNKDAQSIESIGATKNSCDNYVLIDGRNYHVTGEANCSVNLPSLTEKEGYENGKWYDGDTLVGLVGDSYQINASKTLVAKATIKSYNVTYDCSTNEAVCNFPPEQVNHGSRADISKTVEKEKYDFLGWNTDSSAKNGLTEAPIITSDTVLYAIFKKSTSISLGNTVAEYNGQAIHANPAVVSDGPLDPQITYTYYSDSRCSNKVTTSTGANDVGLAPVDVGNYYVKAHVERAPNFKAADSTCAELTINPKIVTISWTVPENMIYNGKVQGPVASGVSGVIGETITITNSQKTNAGSYTSKATITQVDGGRGKVSNYQIDEATKTQDYTILKARPVITFSEESGEVNEGYHITFTEQANLEGSFSNISGNTGVVTVSPSEFTNVSKNTAKTVTITGVNMGTVPIHVTFTPDDLENYQVVTKDYTVTSYLNARIGSCVDKIEYDGEAQSLVSNGRGVVYQGLQKITAGEHTVVATPAEGYRYSDLEPSKTITCSIQKRTTTCSAASITKPYDGKELSQPTGGYCTNMPSADEESITKSTGSIIEPGEVDNVTGDVSIHRREGYATDEDENPNNVTSNYIINKKNGKLIVDYGIATIGTCNPNLVYDDTAKNIATDGTYSSISGNIQTTAGKHEVTYTANKYYGFGRDDNHKVITTKTIECNIIPKEITCTADSGQWTYDGQNHSKTTAGSCSGLIAGHSSIFSNEGVVKDANVDYFWSGTGDANVVKNVEITKGSENVTSNYSINKVNGVLKVRPSATSTVGTCSNPTYNATEQAVANNGVHTTVSDHTGKIDARSYTVTYDSNKNYVFSDGTTRKQAQCSVQKRNTTCTSSSATKDYDGRALTKNNGGECTNLVSGHTAAFVNTGSITNAGTTPNSISSITIASPDAVYGNADVTNNYAITKNEGTLKVNKIDSPIQINAVSNITYGDKTNMVTVTDSKSTGAVIRYNVGSAATATSSTSIPTSTGRNADKYRVYYLIEDTTNYKSKQGYVEVTIKKATATIGVCGNYTYDGITHDIATAGTHSTISNYRHTDAGDYNVKYTADANYQFGDGSTEKTLKCTIKKATASRGTCINPTYNGSSQKIASDGSNVTVSGNYHVDANDYYTVTYTPISSNYAFSSGNESESITCSIAKGTISKTITKPSGGVTYGSGESLLKVSTEVAGAVVRYKLGSSAYYDGQTSQITTLGENNTHRNVGKYNIYYAISAGNNYNLLEGFESVDIVKRSITCTSESKTFNFAQSDSSNVISGSYNIEGQPITYEHAKCETMASGDKAVFSNWSTISGPNQNKDNDFSVGINNSNNLSVTSNYSITKVKGKLTAGKAEGYVRLSSSSGETHFGDSSHSFGISSDHISQDGGSTSLRRVSVISSEYSSGVSASISGKTVTVTGLSNVPAGQSIRIKVTSGETNNHYSAQSFYTIEVKGIKRTATFYTSKDSNFPSTYSTLAGTQPVSNVDKFATATIKEGIHSNTKFAVSCTTSGSNPRCSVQAMDVNLNEGFAKQTSSGWTGIIWNDTKKQSLPTVGIQPNTYITLNDDSSFIYINAKDVQGPKITVDAGIVGSISFAQKGNFHDYQFESVIIIQDNVGVPSSYKICNGLTESQVIKKLTATIDSIIFRGVNGKFTSYGGPSQKGHQIQFYSDAYGPLSFRNQRLMFNVPADLYCDSSDNGNSGYSNIRTDKVFSTADYY